MANKVNINENSKSSNSQCKKILADLLKGKTITAISALNDYGCFRLSGRIWDLVHKQGYNIVKTTQVTKSGKRVVAYKLSDQLFQFEA
jgi:hypothetical protein